MELMSSDATATVPTARSLELPISAYTSGGTKLESADRERSRTLAYTSKQCMAPGNDESEPGRTESAVRAVFVFRSNGRRSRRLTESEHGRQVGELGVADALRDGEAGDGDAGDEVGLEGGQRVGRRPLEEREEVAQRGHGPPPGPALPHHPAERVVREEGLLEVPAERVQERPRRRHRHPHRPRAVRIRAAAHGAGFFVCCCCCARGSSSIASSSSSSLARALVRLDSAAERLALRQVPVSCCVSVTGGGGVSARRSVRLYIGGWALEEATTGKWRLGSGGRVGVGAGRGPGRMPRHLLERACPATVSYAWALVAAGPRSSASR
jgi:hypothetical protein